MARPETLREAVLGCRGPDRTLHVSARGCPSPPGAAHLRHSHPGYLSYVLSHGKGQIQGDNGTWQVEVRADTFTNSQPIAWHELTNVGETTLRYFVVERRYEPAPVLGQTAGNLKWATLIYDWSVHDLGPSRFRRSEAGSAPAAAVNGRRTAQVVWTYSLKEPRQRMQRLAEPR